MIKAEKISRSINSKLLFKDISFELPNNKITGLLGANGAGKTSLFKALAGLTKVDHGNLSFFGKNLNSMSLEERSNSGLNYVPQENSLFDDLTLKENLQAVVELKYKKISKEKSSQIEELLKKMSLEDKAHSQAKFLSGGEKRKTEIVPVGTTFSVEDMIVDEDVVLTFTHNGYVKRTAASTYRSQRRGGRGLQGAGAKEEDFVENIFVASTA